MINTEMNYKSIQIKCQCTSFDLARSLSLHNNLPVNNYLKFISECKTTFTESDLDRVKVQLKDEPYITSMILENKCPHYVEKHFYNMESDMADSDFVINNKDEISCFLHSYLTYKNQYKLFLHKTIHILKK